MEHLWKWKSLLKFIVKIRQWTLSSRQDLVALKRHVPLGETMRDCLVHVYRVKTNLNCGWFHYMAWILVWRKRNILLSMGMVFLSDCGSMWPDISFSTHYRLLPQNELHCLKQLNYVFCHSNKLDLTWEFPLWGLTFMAPEDTTQTSRERKQSVVLPMMLWKDKHGN